MRKPIQNSFLALASGLALALVCAGGSFAEDATGRPASIHESFSRFGVGIKTGESAGGFGSQVSYNFSRHAQVSLGAGGVSPFSWSTSSFNLRTDSYFAIGRYYFDHLYLSTGYSLKVTRVEMEHQGVFYNASRAVHGIPFSVGYEFGDRTGFFFAASAGGLWVPAGGGKTVKVDAGDGTSSSMNAADSGPSLGLSLGYYLW